MFGVWKRKPSHPKKGDSSAIGRGRGRGKSPSRGRGRGRSRGENQGR